MPEDDGRLESNIFLVKEWVLSKVVTVIGGRQHRLRIDRPTSSPEMHEMTPP